MELAERLGRFRTLALPSTDHYLLQKEMEEVGGEELGLTDQIPGMNSNKLISLRSVD